jgi:dihydroorotate dehydrogenase electron transfer subunit
MLGELATIAKRCGIPGQVALEEHMGCGFGACLSCTCPLKPSFISKNLLWDKPALQWSEDKSRVYSLICRDGPIYDIGEVDWEEWLA